MNTMITKVASIDILSSAMEELYQNQIQKRAEENFYQSAVKKLKDSAAGGYSVAQDVLDAMAGRYPHGKKPFDLTDPMLGLTQEEAYAIGGDLEDPENAKGTHNQMYEAHSTGAHGDELLRAMKDEANKGDAGKVSEVAPGASEIAAIENGGIRPVEITPGKAPYVPGPKGNNPTETGHTGEELAEQALKEHKRNNPGNLNVEHATGPTFPTPPTPPIGFEKKQHVQLLNTIEKIANVLGENGFEMSELVADQLINTFIKESK